jgi:hypothetical protein
MLEGLQGVWAPSSALDLPPAACSQLRGGTRHAPGCQGPLQRAAAPPPTRPPSSSWPGLQSKRAAVLPGCSMPATSAPFPCRVLPDAEQSAWVVELLERVADMSQRGAPYVFKRSMARKSGGRLKWLIPAALYGQVWAEAALQVAGLLSGNVQRAACAWRGGPARSPRLPSTGAWTWTCCAVLCCAVLCCAVLCLLAGARQRAQRPQPGAAAGLGRSGNAPPHAPACSQAPLPSCGLPLPPWPRHSPARPVPPWQPAWPRHSSHQDAAG